MLSTILPLSRAGFLEPCNMDASSMQLVIKPGSACSCAPAYFGLAVCAILGQDIDCGQAAFEFNWIAFLYTWRHWEFDLTLGGDKLPHCVLDCIGEAVAHGCGHTLHPSPLKVVLLTGQQVKGSEIDGRELVRGQEGMFGK